MKKSVKKIFLYKTIIFSTLAALSFPLFAGGAKDEIYVEEAVLDPDRIAYNHELPEGNPVYEEEVWAYVMTGEERYVTPEKKITDLCYFSADINAYGEITSVPKPEKVRKDNMRLHLVGTCNGRPLSHMVLDPSFGITDKVVDSLIKGSEGYDGLQIDYENVPFRDRDNFILFLKKLREKLPKEKMLTVALAARTRAITDDSYSYEKTLPYVDRIIIMAYDEHWSGSTPGSVASMDWCDRVAKYCTKVIPKEKLVMGLPFYGRSWQAENYGRAWRFDAMNRELNKNNITHVERENGVPYFICIMPIEVTAFFEDAFSLVTRVRMYKEQGVNKIGFWRLCQDDPEFWNWLEIGQEAEEPISD